jgi:hypothetical protein
MKNSIVRVLLASLISLSVYAAPVAAFAQTTNKAPVEKKSVTPVDNEKTPKPGPFHGKLVAIDKVGKTITVGKRTFQITSDTKLKKGGKPATLEAGVVGEMVSGYVKPSADGKLVASSVNFGPKTTGEAEGKQKAAQKEKQAQ